VKTAPLISYSLNTFKEILGNILEGFGLKTAKEREAMEFLLGNSEDLAPLAFPDKYFNTNALYEVPARSACTKCRHQVDSLG